MGTVQGEEAEHNAMLQLSFVLSELFARGQLRCHAALGGRRVTQPDASRNW